MAPIPESFYDSIDGLVYYSESDNPYTLETLESKSPAEIPAEVARLSDASEGSVKSLDPDVFFQHTIESADANDVILLANAKKTALLHSFLKQHLSDLMVYRVESGVRIPIYIVGALPGNSFIAIKTISVET